MTNKDIYKVWAPFNKKWVDWIRPVPFMAINNSMKRFNPANLALPCLLSLDKSDTSTAIIVDLPDAQGIEVGVLLAKYGYRPIPIYNGTISQNRARSTTDNHTVASALIWGASILSDIEIKDDAPPAFLTDTNRLQRYKIDCSVFDNSWDVYHQDIPSEEYLLQNGISKIIIISNALSQDLKKIFRGHLKKKISIFLTNGYDAPVCIRKGR